MKHLPNLLTLLNATLGVVTIYFIQTDSTTGVVACLLAAALCDVFDGFLARKLGVSGPLGKELDSLSDAISFGAVPAFLWSSILGGYGAIDQPYAIFMGGLVAASSVYRLAKFNLSTDQTIDFIGMPTPANALFALGIWSWLSAYENWEWVSRFNDDEQLIFTLVLVALWAISVYWTNANIRILSLKGGGSPLRKRGQFILLPLLILFSYFFRSLALSIVVFSLPVIGLFLPKTEAE